MFLQYNRPVTARPVRALMALCLGLTSAAAAGQGAESPPDSTFSYESFARAVADTHPDAKVDEIQAEISSLNHQIAGTLPDPILSVGKSGIEMGMAEDESMDMQASQPMQAWTLGATQMLPWPGTLSAAKDAAKAQAKSAQLTYSLNQLQRYLAAKELFLDMADAHEQLRIASETVEQAQKLLEFSQERFRQGVGTHMDVLGSRSEVALLKANIGNLRMSLKNLQANAAVMLGMPAAKPPQFDLSVLADASRSEMNAEQLAQQDLVRDIISAQNVAASANKREAVNRTMPSFSLSATVANMDSGGQSMSVMAGISVPIFSINKRSALEVQSERILQATDHRLQWHQAQKDLAALQLDNLRLQLLDNLNVLHQEVVPAMQEHFEKALAEYSQGRGALRDIVDSQQILLQQQLATLRTRKELAKTELAATRIAAGMFSGDINPLIPDLPLTVSGRMTRGMNDMQQGGMNRRMNSTRNGAGNQIESGRDIGGGGDSGDSMPPAGMPGMGM